MPQTFQETLDNYRDNLNRVMAEFDWSPVEEMAKEFEDCIKSGRRVFVCGNGGSGANAVHIANDFIYPVSKKKGVGLRCKALTENSATLTCMANDEGYDEVFAYQLAVEADKGDVLVVLSGSGNSPNILKALDQAREMGMKSYAILGFSGGKCLEMADVPIHFKINDMQISEDLQMIVANVIMQWLYARLNG